MKPLRFCMITTFYPPYAFGGDGIFVYRLSNMLARRGHEVEVIHCIDSYRALASGDPPPGYPNEPGVTVHGLTSGLGILSPLATHQTGHPFFKARKIRQILASQSFDVIHFHNISLIGGPRILEYGEGIKLYTTHDHWLVCPTSVLLKYKREPCTKPNCFLCTLSYRRPPQLWRYTRMLEAQLRHVDTFIAVSDFTLRRHLADGLKIPIVHIPYCLADPSEQDTSSVHEDDVELPSRPFFLFVGRLEKLKGLQTVIPLLRDHTAFDLVVAGDGDYAGELQRLAAGCDRIHFLGRLTASQLKVAYAAAVALLVPSITYETFGQVIIEAYSARTPVIVRDLGALPGIVAESGGGLVFHDDASLLEAMNRLWSDRALRDRLGQAGFQAYRHRWSEEAHMERYLGLIDEIRARKDAAQLCLAAGSAERGDS